MTKIRNIKNIGIIGGGQLGMFLCKSAKKINKRVYVFSDQENCSAKKFCNDFFFGDFNDLESIKKFSERVDIITVETENIPKETLKTIDNLGKLTPSFRSIVIAQNRLKEKNFLNSLNGIKTTDYMAINNFKDLEKAYILFNKSIIIKSCEFGYDGKNQYKVNSKNLADFKKFSLKNFIAEKVVEYKKEISVISCIDKFNNVYSFPPVENEHANNILVKTKFPALISEEVNNKAINFSQTISKELSIIGVLAVEMFVLYNNDILINEIAPRPHNSGHWTMDGCEFSQFDNVIFSISGQKLKKPKILSEGSMRNIIGDEYKNKDEIKKNYKFYDYYKESIKPKRKMGHYTILKKLSS